jgi:hypothetical protein
LHDDFLRNDRVGHGSPVAAAARPSRLGTLI